MPTILIIEPISSGLRLIPKAKELGLTVVVVSHGRGERRIEESLKPLIDGTIQVDTNDEDATWRAVERFLKDGGRIDAVIPGFEYYVPLAAHLARKIGVRGHSLETATAVRQKNVMRQRLQSAGVPIPRTLTVSQKEQIEWLLPEIRFPSVVKPSDMSGSIQVRRVDTSLELFAACQDIWSCPQSDLGRKPSSLILIEDYVEGPEFSIEGFVADGVVSVVSITEKLLGPEPFFVEMGHIVNCEPEACERALLTRYTEDVIRALNITFGPFHAEVRIETQSGAPLLMEIAARLAGDRICELIDLATGLNLGQIMIQSYLGHEINAHPKGSGVAGITFFAAPGSKSYREVVGLDALKAVPAFREFGVYFQPGEEIPPAVDFSGRVGYATFSADAYSKVKSAIELASELVRFE